MFPISYFFSQNFCNLEFRFLSSKQQECYRLVDALLANDRRGQDFQDPLQEKIDEVLPFIASEEGQEAIRAYGDSYIKLSSFEFGRLFWV